VGVAVRDGRRSDGTWPHHAHRRRAARSTDFALACGMTTKLDKPIRRELEHAGVLYTVTVAPDGIRVVEKGKRKGRELSWSTIISGDAELSEALRISIDATRRDEADPA
jgi:hypothetical protein